MLRIVWKIHCLYYAFQLSKPTETSEYPTVELYTQDVNIYCCTLL